MKGLSLFKPPAVALLNNMTRREAASPLRIFSQTGLFRGVFIAGKNSKVAMGGAGGAQRSILPTSFFIFVKCRSLPWDCPLHAVLWYHQLHPGLGGHLLHSGPFKRKCMCAAVLFALLSVHSELCSRKDIIITRKQFTNGNFLNYNL